MKTKYELTENYIESDGKKLYQIRSLKDFSDIKTGDLGGYISDVSCLSQDDNSWIDANSKVINSTVKNNSRVYNATIYNSMVINSRVVNSMSIVINSRVENSSVSNARVDNSMIINSRVENNSRVTNNSRVENSSVSNARVVKISIDENTKIKTFGYAGSRKDILTVILELDYVATGCFSGTIDEFIKAVDETHGNNEFAIEYRKIIDFARGLR